MGRYFAASDFHGCGGPANKALDWLAPDDTLFFLGDAIDRGPDGFQLMTRLLNDQRVIYLKGNHEALLEHFLVSYLTEDKFDNQEWFFNGGTKTWNKMEELSNQELWWYIHKIRKMPTEKCYLSPNGHNIILEHAGFSPFINPPRSHDPLWDREHFYDDWKSKRNYHSLDPEKTYLIHGHTPVQYLKFNFGYIDQPSKSKEEIELEYKWKYTDDVSWKPEVLQYCYGHKFDIDMCTIASKRVALLDLDTFEIFYFDED